MSVGRGAALAAALLAMLLVAGAYRWTRPVSCHLVHLIVSPADLYEAVLLEDVSTGEASGWAEFTFTPRYCDIYDIGFASAPGEYSAPYRISTHLKASIVSPSSESDDVIAEIDEPKPISVTLGDRRTRQGRIVYGRFDVVDAGKPLRLMIDIGSLGLTMNEPHPVMLFIAASTSP